MVFCDYREFLVVGSLSEHCREKATKFCEISRVSKCVARCNKHIMIFTADKDGLGRDVREVSEEEFIIAEIMES